MKQHDRQGGFGLTEVMVGVALLAIGVVTWSLQMKYVANARANLATRLAATALRQDVIRGLSDVACTGILRGSAIPTNNPPSMDICKINEEWGSQAMPCAVGPTPSSVIDGITISSIRVADFIPTGTAGEFKVKFTVNITSATGTQLHPILIDKIVLADAANVISSCKGTPVRMTNLEICTVLGKTYSAATDSCYEPPYKTSTSFGANSAPGACAPTAANYQLMNTNNATFYHWDDSNSNSGGMIGLCIYKRF